MSDYFSPPATMKSQFDNGDFAFSENAASQWGIQQPLPRGFKTSTQERKNKICNDAADPSRGDTQTTVNCREQAITLIDPAVRGRHGGLQRHGSFEYIFEQSGS
jgi:hypothetical protein